MLVGQNGRLEFEVILFLASLRANSPKFAGQVFIAEPRFNQAWTNNPMIRSQHTRNLIAELGAEFIAFDNKVFGESYPYGNKIECLTALPNDKPFLFFDSDTLILDELCDVPFDFSRPTASLRCTATWPQPLGPGHHYADIWKDCYDICGVDYPSSLDKQFSAQDWRRYLYFNASFFFHENPTKFGARFLEFAQRIKTSTRPRITRQSLDPWLDQVVLPMVIHSFGGGKHTLARGWLDAKTSCHYRRIPLLYAREDDRVIAKLEQLADQSNIRARLSQHPAFQRMIYQKQGRRLRGMIDRSHQPISEVALRHKLKALGYWIR